MPYRDITGNYKVGSLTNHVGNDGVLSVDTTTQQLVVHDGVTPGGMPLFSATPSSVTLGPGSATIGAVIQAGGTGTDYSSSPATIPMNGFVLLTTIPATPTRAYVEVQNQSAGEIQLVRDDGFGNNQTTILLASGGSAGAQGGGWSSATFKGRIMLYGASGAQTGCYQE